MADEVEPRWAALWADYERRAPAEKAEAARRLDALEGRINAVPARTLRNWRAQVRGGRGRISPRSRGSARTGTGSTCS